MNARIYSCVTHDSGATWSTPTIISGTLDQAFVSVPTVAADGRIYVALLNRTDLQTFRDDYELVEVSPQTGAPLGAPVKVAKVFPPYHFAEAMKNAYFSPVGSGWRGGDLLVMGIWGVVGVLLAVRRFSWEPKQ